MPCRSVLHTTLQPGVCTMFLAVFAAAVLVVARAAPCLENVKLSDSDDTVYAQVEALVAQASSTGGDNAAIPFECLATLYDRGYFKSALYLYENYFAQRGAENFDRLNQEIVARRKHLDKFYTKMLTSRRQVQHIEPVVVWAQSKSHIFVQIKLALRRDAPACLNCEQERIQLQPQNVFFSSFGLLSHQPIRWVLDLNLEREINVEESYYQAEAVGTYFFNLSKAVKGELWRDLARQTNATAASPTTQNGDEYAPKKKSVYNIWWELRDKYGEDMDEWIKTLENEELKREQEELEERERQRQLKKNQTQTPKPKQPKRAPQKQNQTVTEDPQTGAQADAEKAPTDKTPPSDT